MTVLAAGPGACTSSSIDAETFEGEPLPLPSTDGDLAAAPRALGAGCPGDSPSCPGPFSVVNTLHSFIIGPTEQDVELCGDLPHAVDEAFENGSPGTIVADVFRPDDGGAWPPGALPLLLLGPGNGMHYDRYDGILEHFASLGVVAVSVGTPFAAGVSRRAEMMQCVLRHIIDDTDLGPHVDPTTVVLAGHSRGGEGAVMVANRLVASTHAIDLSVDVPAVIGIAPSKGCIDNDSGCGFIDADGVPLNAADKEALKQLTYLSDDATDAFLVLQGSRDHDIDGESLGLYDMASQEFPVPGPYMRKSMVWGFDVPHGHWGGAMNNPSERATTIANAYITAFLRWNVGGEHEFSNHFQGNRKPPFCVAWPAACDLGFERPTVFTEYVEGTKGGGGRFVIHDFEVDWDPRIPGSLLPLQGATDVDLYANPGGSRRTTALAMQWNGSSTEATLEFINDLDLQRYDVLSLRAGILADLVTPCVDPPPSFDLAIYVESEFLGVTESHEVLASAYVDLSHPDCDMGPVGPEPHAQTIRVPLADFEGVDLEHIQKIEIRVDDGMGESLGAMFIDSIEAVDNAKYCGNDEIEAPESCDGDDLDGLTCADFGFVGGLLGCNEECRFDTALCNMCGNGVLDPGEACEPGLFPMGLDCGDYGFAQGDLSCEASCTVISTATCNGGTSTDSPGSYANCLNPAERQNCEAVGPAACAQLYGDRDCVGGPCRPTQPSDRGAGSLLDRHNEDGGEFHPDGTYRDDQGDLYYCANVGGESRVCADDNGWGVCRRCDATDGVDNTLLGCPCGEQDDCVSFNVSDPAMSCWGEDFGVGQGTCWDTNAGPPSWQCDSPCGQAPYWGDDEMFCEHYASQARCEPVFACSGPESMICADSQLVCQPNGNGCTNECTLNAHCDQALGWPGGYCCVNDQCQPGVC
ncbi:MAG: hypothetical protein AAGF11_16135 [Myxococcota bacterium]